MSRRGSSMPWGVDLIKPGFPVPARKATSLAVHEIAKRAKKRDSVRASPRAGRRSKCRPCRPKAIKPGQTRTQSTPFISNLAGPIFFLLFFFFFFMKWKPAIGAQNGLRDVDAPRSSAARPNFNRRRRMELEEPPHRANDFSLPAAIEAPKFKAGRPTTINIPEIPSAFTRSP